MGPRDVADVLGVTEPVIRQWLREGDLVGYRVGKSWRVLKSELRAYLISHRNQDVDGTPRRLED
jgi:excisionase family DNA binding protein